MPCTCLRYQVPIPYFLSRSEITDGDSGCVPRSPASESMLVNPGSIQEMPESQGDSSIEVVNPNPNPSLVIVTPGQENLQGEVVVEANPNPNPHPDLAIWSPLRAQGRGGNSTNNDPDPNTSQAVSERAALKRDPLMPLKVNALPDIFQENSIDHVEYSPDDSDEIVEGVVEYYVPSFAEILMSLKANATSTGTVVTATLPPTPPRGADGGRDRTAMEANIVVPHRGKRVTAPFSPPTSKMHYVDDCWCGGSSPYVPREAGAGPQDLGDSSLPYTQQYFPTEQVVAPQYAPEMTFERQVDEDEVEKVEVHHATMVAKGHFRARTLKERIKGLDAQVETLDKDQRAITMEVKNLRKEGTPYFWSPTGTLVGCADDYYKGEDGNPDWEVYRQVFPHSSPEQLLNLQRYHRDQEEKYRPTRTTPNMLTAGFDNGLQFKANADWAALEEDIPSGSHRMHTPPPSPIRTTKFSREENFDEWWAECWENGWALLDETESQKEVSRLVEEPQQVNMTCTELPSVHDTFDLPLSPRMSFASLGSISMGSLGSDIFGDGVNQPHPGTGQDVDTAAFMAIIDEINDDVAIEAAEVAINMGLGDCVGELGAREANLRCGETYHEGTDFAQHKSPRAPRGPTPPRLTLLHPQALNATQGYCSPTEGVLKTKPEDDEEVKTRKRKWS